MWVWLSSERITQDVQGRGVCNSVMRRMCCYPLAPCGCSVSGDRRSISGLPSPLHACQRFQCPDNFSMEQLLPLSWTVCCGFAALKVGVVIAMHACVTLSTRAGPPVRSVIQISVPCPGWQQSGAASYMMLAQLGVSGRDRALSHRHSFEDEQHTCARKGMRFCWKSDCTRLSNLAVSLASFAVTVACEPTSASMSEAQGLRARCTVPDLPAMELAEALMGF